MEDNRDIYPIHIPQDPSLQTFLDSLPEKESERIINEATYKENMRLKDIVMRDHLKILWRQEWDPHAINAVGVLRYHPTTCSDWLRQHLEEQNGLFVEYGICR